MKYTFKGLKFAFFREESVIVFLLDKDVLTEKEAEVLGFRRDVIICPVTHRQFPGGWVKIFWDYNEFAKLFLHLDKLKGLCTL